jgi:putative ABC transport system permease protein
MDPYIADLRLAVRSLARARGFAAAVVVTLALAVALATSLAAIVNAYLIRPLPYPAADRLHTVSYARPGQDMPRGLAELHWDAVADVVEHPISWDLDVFYLIGGDHPERAPGAWVTRGFMDGLGIQPALGRAFAPEEYVPGGPQVALLSDALWRRRFGGDSGVVGRSFEAYVSDRPDDPELFTVIGVLAPGFWHVNPYTEVLTPLRAPSYPYLVRLREGVSARTAEQRLTALVGGGRAAREVIQPVELRPVQVQYTQSLRPILNAIAGAVGIVLLIGGANVAFLAVIRALRRRRELAVRFALGAGRGRVARLLIMEALVLVGAAATLGIALGAVLLRLLAPALEQQLGRRVPGGASALSIDGTVALATGAVLLLLTVALSAGPVLVTSRRPLFALLRRGKQCGAESARGRRARAGLIAVEVAGSLALLTGCGLMMQTVLRLLMVDLGVQPSRVVTTGIGLRERTYPDAARRIAFYERLQAELERMPGVAAAALSTPSPLNETMPQPVGREGTGGVAGVRAVGPAYFAAVGLPLLQGREFTVQDRGPAEPVAVVSETLAQRLWPGGSGLGESVLVSNQQVTGDTAVVPRRVVGVAKDAPQSPGDEELADVYIPLLQAPGRSAALVIRSGGAPRQWLGELRVMLRGIDPDIPVGPVRALTEVMDEQLARPRFLAALFAGFGGFATLLALIGVYGVIAYAVKQREHEIAIRIAVGADRPAIRRLFLREGGVVLLAGIVVGVPAAFGIGRLLRAQLYGVEPMDITTPVAAALLLGAAGLLAVWWPSRRASATDPMLALREE